MEEKEIYGILMFGLFLTSIGVFGTALYTGYRLFREHIRTNKAYEETERVMPEVRQEADRLHKSAEGLRVRIEEVRQEADRLHKSAEGLRVKPEEVASVQRLKELTEELERRVDGLSGRGLPYVSGLCELYEERSNTITYSKI